MFEVYKSVNFHFRNWVLNTTQDWETRDTRSRTASLVISLFLSCLLCTEETIMRMGFLNTQNELNN